MTCTAEDRAIALRCADEGSCADEHGGTCRCVCRRRAKCAVKTVLARLLRDAEAEAASIRGQHRELVMNWNTAQEFYERAETELSAARTEIARKTEAMTDMTGKLERARKERDVIAASLEAYKALVAFDCPHAGGPCRCGAARSDLWSKVMSMDREVDAVLSDLASSKGER